MSFNWSLWAGPDPTGVVLRLILAMLLGGAVAWIHRRTSAGDEMGAGFAATLVLLAILIAAVTQVIGDNVARAFSLVGALSIVRFRTVVRDTRDTAFVIFAVVAGMAAGAQNAAVALGTLLVGGVAAFVTSGPAAVPAAPLAAVSGIVHTLRVRAAMGAPVEGAVSKVLTERGCVSQLASLGTTKQATGWEASWELAALPGGVTAEELVRAVGRLEGIQDVRWERRQNEEA